MFARSAVVLGAAIVLAGCATHREPAVRPPGVETVRTIVLNGHSLRVHAADARQPGSVVRPLLVYATGDRGWAGKDLDVYRHLVAWGYPVAGFDAHDYVKHLGRDAWTTPGRLGADYASIIAAARAALGLPDIRPVVLVGVSRGADLAVVAAGRLPADVHLTGVVAVALTKEEEYVRWFGRSLHHLAEAVPLPAAVAPETHVPTMVQLYEYLPLLRELPLTVIQSTHDKYLPAADARALFGPDTPVRTFIVIDARNHSFAGARDEMYAAVHGTLERLTESCAQ